VIAGPLPLRALCARGRIGPAAGAGVPQSAAFAAATDLPATALPPSTTRGAGRKRRSWAIPRQPDRTRSDPLPNGPGRAPPPGHPQSLPQQPDQGARANPTPAPPSPLSGRQKRLWQPPNRRAALQRPLGFFKEVRRRSRNRLSSPGKTPAMHSPLPRAIQCPAKAAMGHPRRRIPIFGQLGTVGCGKGMCRRSWHKKVSKHNRTGSPAWIPELAGAPAPALFSCPQLASTAPLPSPCLRRRALRWSLHPCGPADRPPPGPRGSPKKLPSSSSVSSSFQGRMIVTANSRFHCHFHSSSHAVIATLSSPKRASRSTAARCSPSVPVVQPRAALPPPSSARRHCHTAPSPKTRAPAA
jgi:hypothetical protein